MPVTPKADVAERTGQPLSTVRRVERETTVSHADDAAERKARGIGRPSKTQEYTDKVRTWLADEPELPTLELLRRAHEAGYNGKKSSFYALVTGLRPTKAVPIVRFEGLPGEFSQHDFGEVVVRYVDGKSERIHFFASRLKYSRFSAVTIVPNQRVEVLVRSIVRHFIAFGGRPLMAVFDRPKTIVTRGGVGRAVEQWNATFAQDESAPRWTAFQARTKPGTAVSDRSAAHRPPTPPARPLPSANIQINLILILISE